MLNRNYILLWCGQLVSQVGNRLYLIALGWYFVSVLNDNGGLFLLFIISSLPSLLFGALAGPLVEKWNKKYTIIGCDILSGILVSLLGWGIYSGLKSTAIIYIICFLLNTVNLLFSPSVNSILPSILPENKMQQGVSYMKVITSLGQILGAAIGGVLVGFIGVYMTIIINSVSFFLSAFSEMFIRYKPVAAKMSQKFIADFMAGLSYIRNKDLVRHVLIITICSNLFITPLLVGLPILVNDILKMDAIYYGIADAMFPLGAICIAVILSYKIGKIRPLLSFGQGVLGIAFCFISVSLINNYYYLLIVMTLYGAFTNYINIRIITYFIQTVDVDFRGRFFSILESFSYSSLSLSYVLISVMSETFSTQQIFVINGIILFIIGIFAIGLNNRYALNLKNIK